MISAIEQLRALLARNMVKPLAAVDVTVIGTVCERPLNELKKTNENLEKRLRGSVVQSIPEDQIREALRRFWYLLRYESFRDAIRVCAGLALPLEKSGPSIMEDRERFPAALQGLQPLMEQPRRYRRCFFGLMHSYFSCDPEAEPENKIKKENWLRLRDYLREGSGKLLEAGKINPDWAHCVPEHVRLFGDAPCAFYANEVLKEDFFVFEDSTVLKPLRQQLLITASSWFDRELVLGLVRAAVAKGDAEFTPLLGKLLSLLEAYTLWRDPGLTLLLERYADIPGRPLHPALRDVAVRWWKNPWLPSTKEQWGGVSQAAKDMVAGWLKHEFVESFFQKLAVDGKNDRRRAEFWLRYVKSMDDTRFALGYNWIHSHDGDVQALLKNMAGLYSSMDVADGSAFIMTLGNIVVVEFGKPANASYVYEKNNLPFDLPSDPKKSMPTKVNAGNSLKNDENLFKFIHSGGWEHDLAGQLKKYGISPDGHTVIRESTPPPPPQARPTTSSGNYSLEKLGELAKNNGFRIENKTSQNGYVWAFPNFTASYPSVILQLQRWGFQHKEGKGWWLKP